MKLIYSGTPDLQPENAGLFISPGFGKHPGRTIPTFELIFVRSGTLPIADEHREFSVSAGETLLLWPHVMHRGIGPYKEDLSFYWIHFRLPPRAGRKRKGPVIPQFARPKRPDRLTELFHRYLDDQESGRLSLEEGRLLIGLMLLEIHPRESPSSTSDTTLAGRAERIIATQFHRGLHPGDIAREIGHNADYLGRIYRRVHGHTLGHAIHLRQIGEARRLLRESDKNIDEIARDSGFAESRYFRKLFRQLQGMSPRAYRSLYARSHINVS